MDRISDSDSEDVGSIPTGTTNKKRLYRGDSEDVGSIPTGTTKNRVSVRAGTDSLCFFLHTHTHTLTPLSVIGNPLSSSLKNSMFTRKQSYLMPVLGNLSRTQG